MGLLIAIFIVSTMMPVLFALVISWREIQRPRVAIVRHAPKRKQSATVLIYHTYDDGTRDSLRQLRRIRAVNLHVIVAVPAGIAFTIKIPKDIIVCHKERPASRELTLASCYRLLDSRQPVCVIESGDIVSATAIHTALAVFRRSPHISRILVRHEIATELSFSSIFRWFSAAYRHSRSSLISPTPRSLTAGTWLRSGTQLRTETQGTSLYVAPLSIATHPAPQLEPLSPLAMFATIALVIVSAWCYILAARLETTLPLIALWITTAWWLVVLASLVPASWRHKLTAATCIPLAGILLPTWCLVRLGATLLRSRLWHRLPRTRRQHAQHGILFRLSHP